MMDKNPPFQTFNQSALIANRQWRCDLCDICDTIDTKENLSFYQIMLDNEQPDCIIAI